MTDAPSKSLIDQLETGKHVLNFLENTDKKGKDKHTVDSLSARLMMLENYWDKLSGNHGLVCLENESLTDKHDYFVHNFYYDYEDAYAVTRGILSQRISVLAAKTNLTACSTGNSTIQVVHNASTLPTFPVPPFSGLQKDWDSFREMFETRVKNVPGVPAVEKLIRLINAVQGEALGRLANMPLIGSNFDVAWSILLSRYDNKRIKLTDALQKVFHMPAVKERSASEIMRLVDTVEEAKRSLISLRRPVEHWDDWFVQLIEIKLDAGTRQDWEKSIEKSDAFPSYAEIKDFLEHRGRSLATSQAYSSGSSHSFPHNKKSDSSDTSSKKKQVRAYAAQVSTGAVTKEKLPCALCKGNHFVSYCPSFINASGNKRWSLVRQAGLCTNCLRKKHDDGVCPSQQRCRVERCNEPHHTFLHDANSNRSSPSSSFVGCTSRSIDSHSSSTSNHRVTLLATAVIRLQSKSGESMLVRALLDPGSEVSFISERAVQKLSLPRFRSTTTVSGVGGGNDIKVATEASLCVLPAQRDDFKLALTALILPTLTAPLPSRAVPQENWPHLEGLVLADPKYFVPGAVDCILGADVYPSLLLEGLKRGDVGEPIAQNTRLGWILTGSFTSFSRSSPPVSSHHVSTPNVTRRSQWFTDRTIHGGWSLDRPWDPSWLRHSRT